MFDSISYHTHENIHTVRSVGSQNWMITQDTYQIDVDKWINSFAWFLIM